MFLTFSTIFVREVTLAVPEESMMFYAYFPQPLGQYLIIEYINLFLREVTLSVPEEGVMFHTYFPQPLSQFVIIKPETNRLLLGIKLENIKNV